MSKSEGLSKTSIRASSFPLSSSVTIGVFILLDSLCFLTTGYITHQFYIINDFFDSGLYPASVIFIWLVSIFLFHFGGLHEFRAIMSPFGTLSQLLVSCITSFLFFLAILFALKVSDQFSRQWTFAFGISSFMAVFLLRLCGFFVINHLANVGIFARNVLIVGGGDQARALITQIEKETPRFNYILGIFDDRVRRLGQDVAGVPVLGDLDALVTYIRKHRVDDIIVTLPWNADERLVEIIARLRELPASIHLGSDLVAFRFPYRPSPNHFIGIPMLEVVKAPLSGWGSAVKWVEDLLLGTLALIVFLPVLLMVGIAIRIESPGPVLFRQKRYGYNNEIFEIYKFRSMHHMDKGPAGKTVQAQRNDPRITKVGWFIRRTSLDELPQLFNVVLGQMSLVGPRPHAVDHNEEYANIIKGYFARHKVKPGITGWAQINGWRGETDTTEKMEQRVRFDTYYVENWSLMFDLQILAKTLFVGFIGKNAR